MIVKKKTKIYIIDTSAILSGKPIYLNDVKIVTTSSILEELKPGGRDYRSFQFLMERGLSIQSPSKESTEKIKTVCSKTGDVNRLSKTDIEILALALEINKDDEKEAVILTDDYSIQNVSYVLNITYESISQSGITKKFKWTCRCRGCGKRFKENIKTCPICGAETKTVISSIKIIKK
jgi:UPF0271 protein